ncbi:MAG: hypothetical protein A2X13_12665 [Bacteroidetes bacterium GWC2_33_15]|nr:MAG: hypothetical protein A2X10_14030 [Bacteroidetes bacterium GWA2_33_15]OFX50639.1 MAG: hypothetical protein A2X13_12665 [Bacteroidetes bacterium GWC2_33_15]OFX63265.1 MAG: hypothetical protein A2X15_02135 [Bacteroidetes bacterium GWB2_32_14]OFX69788.1 MAG: hypothetical protein A2X14_05340 [Bacteroidetes bacterium GWD2_33_33]HAN19828.1 hypothetical protein [Bacteroidales bacterium]
MIKILKYSILIKFTLSVILFNCCIFPVFSQSSVLNKKLSVKSKNHSLYTVLNTISSQIGYEFSYNADLILANRNVKIDADSSELHQILDILLNDTSLTYNIIDKQIVIHKKNSLSKISTISQNQTQQSIIHIRGKILDKETFSRLPFANISINGKSLGTISNEEGEFSFKIPVTLIDENIVFSYIGYKNSVFPLKDLTLSNNIIYLEKDFLSIQEVIIRSNNPELLIKNAMEKIKDNYYTQPFLMTSFYREFVIKNKQYMSVMESVLSVYKSPYGGYYSDQIKMIKSRKNLNYSESDTFLLKLKGGLYASLYLDIIKNPTNFLLEEYFNSYSYVLSDIVKYDNSTAYVIEFKPKYFLEDKSFCGRLYIDTENLAIKYADFYIGSDAIEKLAQELVLKKSMKTKVKPESVHYWVSFRQIKGNHFLNLVRGELEFKVKKRNQIFSTSFKTTFEFAVNDIDTVNVDRFKRNETIETNTIFIDKNFEYDYSFWGDYNYISPDETLEEALIRISKKLQQLESE